MLVMSNLTYIFYKLLDVPSKLSKYVPVGFSFMWLFKFLLLDI